MKNTHCDTYFAYGSNLNLNDWHRCCDDHGFDRGLLRPLGKAYLPDRELSLSHDSSSRRGGALNVLPSIGNAVEEMLYEVTSEAAGRLWTQRKVPPPSIRKLPLWYWTPNAGYGNRIPISCGRNSAMISWNPPPAMWKPSCKA